MVDSNPLHESKEVAATQSPSNSVGSSPPQVQVPNADTTVEEDAPKLLEVGQEQRQGGEAETTERNIRKGRSKKSAQKRGRGWADYPRCGATSEDGTSCKQRSKSSYGVAHCRAHLTEEERVKVIAIADGKTIPEVLAQKRAGEALVLPTMASHGVGRTPKLRTPRVVPLHERVFDRATKLMQKVEKGEISQEQVKILSALLKIQVDAISAGGKGESKPTNGQTKFAIKPHSRVQKTVVSCTPNPERPPMAFPKSDSQLDEEEQTDLGDDS